MMVFLIIIGIIAVLVVCVLLYSNKAFPEAQRIAGEMKLVGKDYYFYGENGIGVIIFSGAKTDERAYAYIAKLLHDEGCTVVIPKQPFHMSAFGAKHGMEIMDSHSEVEKWILIGHSLGGMPVSRIAAARPESLKGIAYLATFASVDLSDTPVSAIRITAENDGVMDNDMMKKYDGHLPQNAKNVMLEGANHQGFAAYRSTSGRDGKASMTWQEQNERAVKLILEFFNVRQRM